MSNNTAGDQVFRNSISTVTSDGKRNWLYPSKPRGPFYNVRTIFSIVYLVLFFTLPFLRINGQPVFLFNVLERKFIFFGSVFWPQDFFIFGLGMLAFILFVVLFTVIFGRVFCGWACPQTIFMEMIFRRIEYWIEGDAQYQKKLNQGPVTVSRVMKKTLKHTVFFIISFIISNTFLAYIIGTDELFRIIREPLSMHVGAFVSIIIFTVIFYGVYAWFREQVCLIACPYGRLQGVMTDKNTLLIAYDYVRGEPRARFKKDGRVGKGDCIDCSKCVKVCPMGIDIRNGTQLECTGCTACIDACDEMMEGVGLPKGLIRYASENAIANRKKFRFTGRVIAYISVLTVIIGLLAVLIVTRKDVQATVLRTPGMLFQKQENHMISNLYNIKIINKTQNDIPVELKLESGKGYIKMVGKQLLVRKESKTESGFFIFMHEEELTQRKTALDIGVYTNGKRTQTIKTYFLGPFNIQKKSS